MNDRESVSGIRGFKYSPQTGNVYRNKLVGGRGNPGIITGKSSRGYRWFVHDSKRYLCHRFIIELMTKAPVKKGMHVDHVDGNKTNNKWTNLRVVSPRTNAGNQKCHRDGKLVGSTPLGNKFAAQIQVNGKKLHLGMFDTEIEAHQAYIEFARRNGQC